MKQTTSEILVINPTDMDLKIVGIMDEELGALIREGKVVAFHLGNRKKFDAPSLEWVEVAVVKKDSTENEVLS
jgi:hypothetical protein